MKKLALKKLKASDLSFFKSYLTKHPQTKQKGLNLDLRVMQGQFFPSLKALLEPLDKMAAHVDLTMFGPGMASAHSLARKVKRDAKNIRLNGEIVDSPVDQPGRYDVLAPGDFAIMEFVGAALPRAVSVVLIAAGHREDSSVHSALQPFLPFPDDSMKTLSEDDLRSVVNIADPSVDHPIRDWLDTDLLEEVGQGDATAAETLNKRRPGRGLSPSDFKASKDSAERTGRLGEELLDQFLRSPGLPDVLSYEWVAQTNAISPFDFRLGAEGDGERHADAKSTSGKFENPIYLSIAEVRHAVEDGVPYDIFRLYDVKETSAFLKIAKDVGPRLALVLTSLKGMPAGVRVDSLSFDPLFFDFDSETYCLEVAVDDDEEVVGSV